MMIAISIVVPLVVFIPAMIVLKTAVFSVPIAGEESSAFITGGDPMRTDVGSASPVTGVPPPVAPVRIPVTVDPDVIRAGSYRPNAQHPGRRRRADLNADSDLGGAIPDCQEERAECDQCESG